MKLLRSVSFKLLSVALVVVFVINSIIVLSDLHETGKLLVATEKDSAIMHSALVQKNIEILMLEKRSGDLQGLIEETAREHPELHDLRLFHPQTGLIIASADSREIGSPIYAKDWNKFTKGEFEAFIIQKDGKMFASKVLPLRNKPSCHGCHPPDRQVLGVMDLEVSLDKAGASLKELAAKHFAGLLTGFGIILAVFLLQGVRLISRPLRQLTDGMQKVGTGDLNVRVNEGRQDEFGYLARGFNSMVTSLDGARKEIEELHSQQLERASKLASIGEIVSGIAHEIKNPLTGISCAIQVLNAEYRDDDPKKAVISEILNQIKRLDRTVKDLLSYAKTKPPEVVLTNVRNVLDKALFFMYPEARKQSVVISTRYECEPCDVLIDPDQVQQVCLNLMINAVQAMPSGGTLTVTVQTKGPQELQAVTGRAPGADKVLAICFEDTGKGIPPEDIPHIFEPFFTRKTQGTGLGLSISQKIVHCHGGDIVVSSEVGRGTTFTLYLPLFEHPPGSPPPRQETGGSLGTG